MPHEQTKSHVFTSRLTTHLLLQLLLPGRKTALARTAHTYLSEKQEVDLHYSAQAIAGKHAGKAKVLHPAQKNLLAVVFV